VESNTVTVVTHERYDTLGPDGAAVSSRYVYTGNPEQASANAIHVYSVRSQGRGVDNVRTIIQDSNGNAFKEFQNGDIISQVTLEDWMQLAGVDLERRNIQSQLDTHPFYRTTGLVLLVRMEYSNLRPFAAPVYDPLCTVTVEALPQAWGFLGSRIVPGSNATGSGARESVQQTGVRLIFIQSGRIGTLDFVQLILRLVEGTVLFNLARFATDFVGELPCCLGRRFLRRTSDEVETAGHTTPGCYCMFCACGSHRGDNRGSPTVGDDDGDGGGDASAKKGKIGEQPGCGATGWCCSCGLRRCRVLAGCFECGVPLLPGGEQYDSALVDEQMSHPIRGRQRHSEATALVRGAATPMPGGHAKPGHTAGASDSKAATPSSGGGAVSDALVSESPHAAAAAEGSETAARRRQPGTAKSGEGDSKAHEDGSAHEGLREALHAPVHVPWGAVGCCACLGEDDAALQRSIWAMSRRSGLVRRSTAASNRRSASAAAVAPGGGTDAAGAVVVSGAAHVPVGKPHHHGHGSRFHGGRHGRDPAKQTG
jgi:hypothetical protein